MRILPPAQRKQVLKEVCDYVTKNTKFQLPDCDVHVQVIPGETEGLYGWIAANYLLGGFDKPQDHDHGKQHNTYGFLDMGGASAQIAFAPNATEADKHANDLTLMRLRTVGGTPLEYKVFVTTWLGFGVNQARQRYVKALLDSTSSKELPDPCLPAGLEVDVTKEGKFIEEDSDDEDGEEEEEKPAAKLHGTGKFQECLHQTFPLLEKEKECLDEPCLLNGQHVPAIDFDVNHFVGVSEYWHTTHEIFEDKHKEKAYDFKTYQERVSEFCNQDWKHIQKGIGKHKWGKKVDEEKAREVCFKASWIINMLHDGIGVPRVGIEPLPSSSKNTTKAVLDSAKEKGFLDPFQAVNKINDVEVSWTLGKMVLFASSEVPPPDEKALAVGFGSNAPGIPKDFQYPGGSYLPWQQDPLDDDNWHRLFVEYPSRIPALLIFILILIVIISLILGKEKRAIVRSYTTSLFRRKTGKTHPPLKGKRRGFLPSKLLFGLGSSSSSGQNYERVDAAESGLTPNDFELEETYLDSSDDDRHTFSDDSEGSRSRVGRTSGWATPQVKEPLTPGYFAQGLQQDGLGGAPGQGLGLQPLNAIERGGLLARTDSRERIRSRASSPKRARSKMGSLDE